jgi:O-antigen ligase
LSSILSFSAFFFIPFLGGNHLAIPYITIDRFWIETSFILLLIGAIIPVFLKKKQGDDFSAFLIWFAPFLLVSALSLSYTWNIYSSIKEINVLIWVVGAVYLYSISARKTVLLDGLVAGSVASVICAVLQLTILFPQLAALFTEGKYAMMVQEKSVPFSAFVNENLFGGFLVLVLPIAVVQGFMQKRLPHAVACVVIVTGILMSLSRLSVIIMIFELITLSVILLKAANYKQLLMLSAVCLCGLLLFLAIGYNSGKEREKGMQYWIEHKASTALTQAKTLDRRTEIWKNGMNAFFSRPAFGYGAGTFEYAYRRSFDGGLYTKYAHSGVVKIAVELGLTGLLAFGAYLFAVLAGIRREGRFQTAFALASIFGFLFFIVDYALDIPALIVTFFVFSSTFLTIKNSKAALRFAKPLFLFMMIVLISSFAFTARSELSRKVVENAQLFEENGFSHEAYGAYIEAAGLMPLDNEPLTRIVGILARRTEGNREAGNKDNLRIALDKYFKLLLQKRDSDSEIFFVSALAYRSCGNPAKAEEFIMKAIDLYPSSSYYVSEAADWHVRSGEFDKALALIVRLQPYIENIRRSSNPSGLYLYRLNDLEAEIAHRKGDTKRALVIAENNLMSVNIEEFAITSAKARELVRKEWLLQYLSDRVGFYKEELEKRRFTDG